jgi:predicted HicB family RNase H-like nuclease
VSLGKKVAILADSTTWWIGDWLVFGQHAFGNRYRVAAAETGLDYQTLRNYAWVAASYPPSRRRDNLSFGHHAEVASFSEDDQDAWLLRCSAERWSRNELRRRLRAAKKGAVEEPRLATIELRLPADRRERWEAAASAQGCTLSEWIETTLERAAEASLAPSLVAA